MVYTIRFARGVNRTIRVSKTEMYFLHVGTERSVYTCVIFVTRERQAFETAMWFTWFDTPRSSNVMICC
jgi:hypothetical protein